MEDVEDNEYKLLVYAFYREFHSTKNPYLTKETIVMRVLQRFASIANVSWQHDQRCCVLNEDIHRQIIALWDFRRRAMVPTLDEQQCVERVLGRDRVRSTDLVKLAQVLGKVHHLDLYKLFAVDGYRGPDVKSYVDTFVRSEDPARAAHVDAVRALYDSVRTPEAVHDAIEASFAGESDTEATNLYTAMMGDLDARDWRLNEDPTKKQSKKRKIEDDE